MEKKTWALIAIASIPLMMTLGNSMLIPVIPAIERELALSTFQGSLIITVYSIVAVPFIPIAGFLSDRFGRKTVIIPSLILTGLGGLLAGLAAVFLKNSFMIILGARLIQGIGAAGAFPLVLPLARDIFVEEAEVTHALGIVETSNTFGKVLSPILGSALAIASWYAPFIAIPILAAISLLLVTFGIKSPDQNEDSSNLEISLTKLKNVFREEGRWLVTIYISGCIIMLVLFGILFYLSERLESQYQIYDISKGLILAIPLAGLCTASYITGRLLGEDKAQMKWAAFGGMALLAITSGILAYCYAPIVTLVILVIGFSGIGIALPSLDSLITENIAEGQNGTVTSIYNSMRFVGVAAGPPLFAFLMKLSHLHVFWAASAISMISVFLIFKFIKTSN